MQMENFSRLADNIGHIVGNHEYCNLLFLIQPFYETVKILDRGRIKPCDRLVQNQEPIRGAQRPRDQNPLLLAP